MSTLHGTWRRLKRYNHYEQEGTDAAEAVEEPNGEWVRFEDAKQLIGELEDVIQDAHYAAMGDDL